MRYLALCGTAALALASACGGRSGNTQASSHTQSLASAAIDAQVGFNYQPAKPLTVNGKPVLAHRYWACVDTVTVTFPAPMRLGSVVGAVYLEGQTNLRRALSLRSVDPTFRQFVFAANTGTACNDFAPMQYIVVGSDAYSVAGDTLPETDYIPLQFPPSQDDLPSAVAEPAPVPVLRPLAATPRTAATSSSFTVTPERLNAALAAMVDFPKAESANPLYAGGLQLMPLEYLLTPFAAPNRERQYGSPDTLYALRRAARFVQLLFPGLQQIPVADMSEPDGSTPSTGDWVLHPDGSHIEGKDVDIAYITTGSGNDPNAAYDFEKNFWLVYGLLDSTGVDMIITAYQQQFSSLAQAAYGAGLINAHAVGRFGALMQDFGMNHDKHMHVSTTNLQNGGVSRKFTPADDAYACYLALSATTTAGTVNLCDPSADQ